jgi:hypothetical protein
MTFRRLFFYYPERYSLRKNYAVPLILTKNVVMKNKYFVVVS